MRVGVVVAVMLIGLSGLGVWYLTMSSTAHIGSEVQTYLRAVHERPGDPQAWLALGDAQSAREALSAAEQAYRTAVEVGEAAGQDTGAARARLGFLLYERGRDAEAHRWLKEAHRLGAQVPLLDEVLAQLASDTADAGILAPPVRSSAANEDREPQPIRTDAGTVELDAAVWRDAPIDADDTPAADNRTAAAPARPVSDTCAVPMVRRPSGALLVDGVVNDTDIVLLVDTGATMTVLNRSAAQSANVRRLPGRLIAQTANGQTEMQLGQVAHVVLGDRVVEDVRVAICDECIATVADGLLGLDVQARFDVQVDVVARRLLFADCR